MMITANWLLPKHLIIINLMLYKYWFLIPVKKEEGQALIENSLPVDRDTGRNEETLLWYFVWNFIYSRIIEWYLMWSMRSIRTLGELLVNPKNWCWDAPRKLWEKQHWSFKIVKIKISSKYKYEVYSKQYLLKASIASKGVITGARNSLLSKRAVWAQETYMKTSHCPKCRCH